MSIPAIPEATARTVPPARLRPDLQIVADMIEPGSRVLDVGCGDGALLHYLVRHKQVDGRGIELSQEGVNASVSLGLAVIQGDAGTDLKDYPANSFDFVILSQTLQTIYDVRGVLDHLLRIGRRAIVSFPNFGYWRMRAMLALTGHAPRSEKLPYAWYDSPNIRVCTIIDFLELADEMGISVERSVTARHGRFRLAQRPGWLANLMTQEAVFMLRRE
jgi:methionine biosynthesis protein MetW